MVPRSDFSATTVVVGIFSNLNVTAMSPVSPLTLRVASVPVMVHFEVPSVLGQL